MIVPQFDENRSEAIRRELVRLIERPVSPPLRTRRPWVALTAIALTSALAGGAVSAVVAVGLNPPISGPAPIRNPDGSTAAGNPGVEAPAGTLPGAPIISMLGASASQFITADTEISLTPPSAATHVRVTLTCTTEGSISWGLGPGGNNPSSSCGVDDVSDRATSWMDFNLSAGTVLYVSPSIGAEGIVSLQFITQVETAWGINRRGESFGVAKPGFGEPDLLAVTAKNGKPGYVNRVQLADADGTTAAESFDSPVEALLWQESMKGESISVPVYESDGTTVIGEFVIQF